MNPYFPERPQPIAVCRGTRLFVDPLSLDAFFVGPGEKATWGAPPDWDDSLAVVPPLALLRAAPGRPAAAAAAWFAFRHPEWGVQYFVCAATGAAQWRPPAAVADQVVEGPGAAADWAANDDPLGAARSAAASIKERARAAGPALFAPSAPSALVRRNSLGDTAALLVKARLAALGPQGPGGATENERGDGGARTLAVVGAWAICQMPVAARDPFDSDGGGRGGGEGEDAVDDGGGRLFYQRLLTGETQWQLPQEVLGAPEAAWRLPQAVSGGRAFSREEEDGHGPRSHRPTPDGAWGRAAEGCSAAQLTPSRTGGLVSDVGESRGGDDFESTEPEVNPQIEGASDARDPTAQSLGLKGGGLPGSEVPSAPPAPTAGSWLRGQAATSGVQSAPLAPPRQSAYEAGGLFSGLGSLGLAAGRAIVRTRVYATPTTMAPPAQGEAVGASGTGSAVQGADFATPGPQAPASTADSTGPEAQAGRSAQTGAAETGAPGLSLQSSGSRPRRGSSGSDKTAAYYSASAAAAAPGHRGHRASSADDAALAAMGEERAAELRQRQAEVALHRQRALDGHGRSGAAIVAARRAEAERVRREMLSRLQAAWCEEEERQRELRERIGSQRRNSASAAADGAKGAVRRGSAGRDGVLARAGLAALGGALDAPPA